MKTSVTIFSMMLLTMAALLAGPLVNTKGGLALEGYDPVAFQTESQAVKGAPMISTVHEGAKYLFANAENRALFEADPEKYAPAYGGYCAWAVAAKSSLAPVKIETWQIVEGRLILNFNNAIKKRFNNDLEGNLQKADANWPKVVDQNS